MLCCRGCTGAGRAESQLDRGMSVGRDCDRISLICCSTFSGNYERDKLAKGERHVGSGGNSLMMNKMIGSKEGETGAEGPSGRLGSGQKHSSGGSRVH